MPNPIASLLQLLLLQLLAGHSRQDPSKSSGHTLVHTLFALPDLKCVKMASSQALPARLMSQITRHHADVHIKWMALLSVYVM